MKSLSEEEVQMCKKFQLECKGQLANGADELGKKIQRDLFDNMNEIAVDIKKINCKYSNGHEAYNSVESILNSASYYKNPYEQVASITSSIARHAFENGNKRTAIETMKMLLKDFGLEIKL